VRKKRTRERTGWRREKVLWHGECESFLREGRLLSEWNEISRSYHSRFVKSQRSVDHIFLYFSHTYIHCTVQYRSKPEYKYSTSSLPASSFDFDRLRSFYALSRIERCSPSRMWDPFSPRDDQGRLPARREGRSLRHRLESTLEVSKFRTNSRSVSSYCTVLYSIGALSLRYLVSRS